VALSPNRTRSGDIPARWPTRVASRWINFKGEDEAEGEEIGPVFITDYDDPDFLHEVGWMKISDARELARGLGHAFSAD